MNTFKFTSQYAEYNCNTYGSGDYGGVCNASASTDLADTGFDVLIPIFLGISLVVAGAILLTRRWLRKRKATQAQAS